MKKAYTFIETITVVIILGILFVITMMNVDKLKINSNVTRFKKGYASIENAVSNLINNKTIYPSLQGFKDIDPVILENVNEIIGKNKINKFREGVKYVLNVTKDNIDCKICSGGSFPYNYSSSDSSTCFLTNDGVLFGIPDTDFDDIGKVVDKDYDGDKVDLVPITMYVDYKPSRISEKDPLKDAFIIGVKYDGTIQFVRTYGDCEHHPEHVQCKLDDYINANTVRVTEGEHDEN